MQSVSQELHRMCKLTQKVLDFSPPPSPIKILSKNAHHSDNWSRNREGFSLLVKKSSYFKKAKPASWSNQDEKSRFLSSFYSSFFFLSFFSPKHAIFANHAFFFVSQPSRVLGCQMSHIHKLQRKMTFDISSFFAYWFVQD